MATPAAGRQPSGWVWSCDRILVATDGSAPSLRAVRWAARIAEDVPAELSVVYAYDVDAGGGVPNEADAAAARSRLARWCAERGAAGFGVRYTAEPGDPRSVLRDAIGRDGPDLVVAGTRGGGGFPGLALGSITEWLSQVATFPLAVVPDTGQVRSGGPILVGIDGSDRSAVALDWAIGLADPVRTRCVDCVNNDMEDHREHVDCERPTGARHRQGER